MPYAITRGIIGAVLLGMFASAANAQRNAVTVAPAAAGSALEGLLIATLEQTVPREIVDDRKWGYTKYQTVGLKVERDGYKLEFRRRKREVNDGLWKLYRIDLPEANHWEVSLSEMRDLGDGRAGFEATFATPLEVLGRASQWERGVQLYSVSAQADAKVRLTVRCELRLELVGGQLPPAIRLVPLVTDADLRIERFRLNRISQLHGPLVRELGEEVHDFAQRELNKRRDKIVVKLNDQIEKHADKLTLSWSDLPWEMARAK